MKHFLLNRSLLFSIGISGCLLIPGVVRSQDDTIKLQPRIELNYFLVNDELPYLTTRVRIKKDNRWEPVKWVIVNLFLNEETKLGMMGNVTTDPKGEGKYILPSKFKLAWDSLDQYTFIARIKGDDKVTDAKKIINIKRSSLQVETKVEDSARSINITFKERQKEKWIPIPEIELKAFIYRNFGKLSIGEDAYTTDEAGTAKVEFMITIPGDEKGNIQVGAAIEDHEDYGNLTATRTVAWGLALSRTDNFWDKRTLWSTRERTPLWLLIFPNLMILLVWGVIIYLVIMIFALKRIHRNSLKNS